MILDFNKIIQTSTIFLFSYSLHAQEINEDFINSLPSSVKQDVLNQVVGNISNNDSNEKSYSAFDTGISVNPLESSEAIKEDFSNLKRFGEDFFKSFPSTFMPINDPSANSEYILDIDDKVFIQVITGDISSEELVVNRDGAIYIPNVGPLNVAGVSLGNANKLINATLQKYFIDINVVVTLSSVRDIQILVAGQVNFPGVYTLGGYSSILHAIGSAGGINSNGSFRDIKVKRNGKTIKSLDLYDLFTRADTSSISSLRSGDAILVSASNKQVRVIGAVNNPAIYEFVEGESAEDIISYAGGASNLSQNGLFFISRHRDKTNNKYTISSKDEEDPIKLLTKDNIFLPYTSFKSDDLSISPDNSFITKPINISGGIKNPGDYYLEQDETLSSLINRAGGYTEDAYPFGGVLLNNEALNLEVEYNARLYSEAIKSLATLATSSSQDVNISNLLPLLEEFKNIKPIGRIQTEFDSFKIELDPAKDMLLSHGDKIFIPFKSNVVHVFGEVLNSGSKSFIAGNTAKDYIDASGGINKSADKSSIIIVHANGDTERINLRRSLFGKADANIFPGSVIYVTRDLESINSIQLLSTFSPIISSLAISLASLNSINRN